MNWKANINIKDLLSKDTSPQAVVIACHGIQKRMSRIHKFPNANDHFDLDTLDDILYEFGYIARTSLMNLMVILKNFTIGLIPIEFGLDSNRDKNV